MIWIEKGSEKKKIPYTCLHEWTGAPYLSTLQFSSLSLLKAIAKQGAQLEQKGELSLQQAWLGRYFEKEILSPQPLSLCLRWINETIGWGVFAEEKIPEMTFIAEYTGLVRKRLKEDRRNSYCFEYLLASGIETPYNVDARSAGGIARYINHSNEGNLESALATTEGITHIILYSKRAIAPGEQLLYDYGPDYWKQRSGKVSF